MVASVLLKMTGPKHRRYPVLIVSFCYCGGMKPMQCMGRMNGEWWYY